MAVVLEHDEVGGDVRRAVEESADRRSASQPTSRRFIGCGSEVQFSMGNGGGRRANCSFASQNITDQSYPTVSAPTFEEV